MSAISSAALYFFEYSAYVLAGFAHFGLIIPTSAFLEVSLAIATGTFAGVALYFGVNALIAGTSYLYQRIRYTDKQRYKHALSKSVELSATLQEQFDNIAKRETIKKWEQLQKNAVSPTFDAKGKLTSSLSRSKLSVFQYKINKLQRRAELLPQVREASDKKFEKKSFNQLFTSADKRSPKF
jgi:hypothetical protein